MKGHIPAVGSLLVTPSVGACAVVAASSMGPSVGASVAKQGKQQCMLANNVINNSKFIIISGAKCRNQADTFSGEHCLIGNC